MSLTIDFIQPSDDYFSDQKVLNIIDEKSDPLDMLIHAEEEFILAGKIAVNEMHLNGTLPE